MSSSRWLRRLFVVCVLVVGLAALPAGTAFASADDADEQDSGLIEELIDWIVGMVGSEPADESGDTGPQSDPMG